jgi:hypothetical protein
MFTTPFKIALFVFARENQMDNPDNYAAPFYQFNSDSKLWNIISTELLGGLDIIPLQSPQLLQSL